MKVKGINATVLSLFFLCVLGCSNISDNSVSNNKSSTPSEPPKKVEENNSYRSYSVARNPAGQPVKSSDGFEYSMFDTRQVNKGSCSSTRYSSNSNSYDDGYEDGYEEGYQDAQRVFDLK